MTYMCDLQLHTSVNQQYASSVTLIQLLWFSNLALYSINIGYTTSTSGISDLYHECEALRCEALRLQ